MFELDEKGSFSVFGYVNILDSRGVLFYEFDAPYSYFFNLPKGKYLIQNGEAKCEIFKQRFFVKLPSKERFIKIPKIKVLIKNTPNLANMYKKQGVAIIDPMILDMPKFCFDFLKFHELGHYFYSTEKYCDLFAASKMLAKGYNPSQIFEALDLLIDGARETEDNIERKKYLDSNLIKR